MTSAAVSIPTLSDLARKRPERMLSPYHPIRLRPGTRS